MLLFLYSTDHPQNIIQHQQQLVIYINVNMKQTKEEKTKHQYPHQHKHQESRVDTHTIFNVKLIYGLLLLVRILITTRLSGYIHPDEFFQGGQELFYGCSSCSMPCSKPNVNGDQDVDIVKNNCHYQEDKEDDEYQVLKRYQLHTFLDHNNEETFLKTNSNINFDIFNITKLYESLSLICSIYF